MKTIQFLAIAASLLIAQPVLAADTPKCNTDGYGPWHYQLFIDEPTAFAFIKTPCGWHFVRQIERERVALAMQMAQLPPQSIEADLNSPVPSSPER
jgi:hypothetical protein